MQKLLNEWMLIVYKLEKTNNHMKDTNTAASRIRLEYQAVKDRAYQKKWYSYAKMMWVDVERAKIMTIN